MNWLRVDSSIRDHPKCKKLGVLLSKERAHSYIIDLWGWAAKYCKDGDITEASDLDIALACGWEGEPIKLVSALLECKLIDREGELLLIHDWQEHQGKLIERASLSAQRSREWRERMRDNKQNASQTHSERIPNETIRNERNERNGRS